MWRRARLPIAVVLVGVVLTALMATIQRASAEREQSLIFDGQVTEEHERFADQLDSTMANYGSGVSFIRATYPSSLAQYRRFFADSPSMAERSDLDPGIMLIEPVTAEDLPALTERETQLGNPDLQVVSLGPVVDGTHYVVTRTAEPTTISGFPLIGFDVGSLGPNTFAEMALPESGRATYILDDSSAFGAFFANNVDETEAADRVIILESINDPATGEVKGWVAQFFDPLAFIRELPDQPDPSINVAVEMLGVTEVISIADRNGTPSLESAPLRREVADNTHDLPWTLTMWAIDDLGVGTGVFDQVGVWVFGLLATLGFAIVSIWRAIQEHQLELAAFELEHARTLAATDPLTGLLNRQGFIETVEQMPQSEGGTVFFLDLDGFKAINDTHGHAKGDQVLRDVARLLRAQFRSDDVVSRFGGDEFVIYTPGLAGGHMEAAIAKRVCDAVASADHNVSSSLGTAVLMPGAEAEFDDVLSRADAAMYRAKQQGGNRFESAAA